MNKNDYKELLDKIPDDEPIFIIRGQDLLAKNAVAQWISDAQNNKVSGLKIDLAYIALSAIANFQINNPERCKIPD